ncbi:MAG: hypothetical protein H6Q70_1540 [Firmicutes bacterium]|nr:hypothetical protein [Bacillota bacterium]
MISFALLINRLKSKTNEDKLNSNLVCPRFYEKGDITWIESLIKIEAYAIVEDAGEATKGNRVDSVMSNREKAKTSGYKM